MAVRKKLKLTEFIPKEYDEQKTVCAWALMNEGRRPELRLLHASLNGAALKSPKQAMTLKWAGLKNGVPDLHLPVVRRSPDGNIRWAGLYIELKRKGASPPSVDQQWWILLLREQCYRVEVCRGAREAISVIEEYLSV